ncbi:MAG TPA: SRPBCC family protein [Roseiflexaceae bacterium]|nr:SRPBCC family protein [Roseiflexaceae bacterium]
MPTFEFHITIHRSATEVFDLLADLEGYRRWLPRSRTFSGVAEIAPLPVQVGTAYQDIGRAGRMEGRVTALVPGEQITFQQRLPRAPGWPLAGLDILIDYRLRSVADGTAVQRSVTVEPHGLLRLLHTPLLTGIRRENARVLWMLKQYLEVMRNA